ncbi:MAG: hypothetical protein AAF970_10120 [Bacteroidota bacterium]
MPASLPPRRLLTWGLPALTLLVGVATGLLLGPRFAPPPPSSPALTLEETPNVHTRLYVNRGGGQIHIERHFSGAETACSDRDELREEALRAMNRAEQEARARARRAQEDARQAIEEAQQAAEEAHARFQHEHRLDLEQRLNQELQRQRELRLDQERRTALRQHPGSSV